MLSYEEKKEMLEDGLSRVRRDDFRFTAGSKQDKCLLDEFLVFLNSAQEVFGPFKSSEQPIITKFNKL